MTKFTTSVSGEIFEITVPDPFEGSAVEDFISESKAWLLQPATLFILDFAGHSDVKQQAYRAIVQLHKHLTKNGKHLASLGINKQLQLRLASDGVGAAFCPVDSLEIAKAKFLSKAVPPKKSDIFDPTFVKVFADATLKTLSVQARTEGHTGKPFLRKTDDQEIFQIDIAGVISLASDKMKGSITIGFPAHVFLKIYENMFDEKQEKITPEIQDAAAEILNIIYGTAKTELNRTQGCDFKPALPTVLSGEKLTIRSFPSSPTIVLPFETSAGPFLIEVAVEKI